MNLRVDNYENKHQLCFLNFVTPHLLQGQYIELYDRVFVFFFIYLF